MSGRVMWTFYVKPEAKATVEDLARQRGEPASETLRQLLAVGLRNSGELPPSRGEF